MNCVKFVRGTPDAFKKLAEKDVNTFYMISNPGDSNCHLYIGNKHVDNEYILYDERIIDDDTKNMKLPAGVLFIHDYKDEHGNGHIKYKIGNGKSTFSALPYLGESTSIENLDQIIEKLVEKITGEQDNALKALFYCGYDEGEEKIIFFNDIIKEG